MRVCGLRCSCCGCGCLQFEMIHKCWKRQLGHWHSERRIKLLANRCGPEVWEHVVDDFAPQVFAGADERNLEDADERNLEDGVWRESECGNAGIYFPTWSHICAATFGIRYHKEQQMKTCGFRKVPQPWLYMINSQQCAFAAVHIDSITCIMFPINFGLALFALITMLAPPELLIIFFVVAW